MSGWRGVRWATKSNGTSSNEPGAASGMRLVGCSASTTPPSSDSPASVCPTRLPRTPWPRPSPGAWAALPRYRRTGAPFVAWLYGIARHVVADMAGASHRVNSQPEVAQHPHDPWPGGDDRIVLAAALAQLPEEQRRVIELKFLVGLTNAEVGVVLAKKPGAVEHPAVAPPSGDAAHPGFVMRNRLADDLGRWEKGELSLVELEARHPGHDVGALVGVHARMVALTDQPVPDPEPAWAVLSTALAAHPRVATRRRQPSRRRLVAAIVAAMIAMPAVSYAAAPDAVRAVARHVTDLLPGADDADPVAPIGDGPPTTPTIPAKGDSRELDEVDEGTGTGSDADEEQDRDDPDDGRDDAPAGDVEESDVEESEEHSAPPVDEDPTEAPDEQAGPQDKDDD